MTCTYTLLLVALLFAPSASAQQLRAFWADAYHAGCKTPAEADAMIDNVAAAHANAIIIEVRRDGGSYYLNSPEPPAEDPAYAPGFDALQYTIDKAHAHGIEVHAWFPVTPLWRSAAPPRDARHLWNVHGPTAEGDAMWLTTNSAGKRSTALDPGHPDAAKYLADLVLDVAARYAVDGIHLDYIRYPEDDYYGWNARAVTRFNRLYGRSGSPAAADPDWSDFRRDQTTALVRQIYLRALEMKPKLKVSAALITWGDGPPSEAAYRTKDAYGRVFQDWRAWLEEGIVDVGMPMNYFRETTNSTMLDHWLAFEKGHQYNRAIAPGTAVYLNSIPDSLKQLDRVLAPMNSGVTPLGVIFYSYASTNTLDANGVPTTPNAMFYRAAGDYFKTDAAPPALAWKDTPDKGFVLGTITVIGGNTTLNDGIKVSIESDSGRPFAVQTKTDGTGFFGSVDLPPDRYRIRLLSGGLELFRTVSQDVKAGSGARFDVQLSTRDFDAIRPRLTAEAGTSAAPGDLVTLNGVNLAADYMPATSVPLPFKLDSVDVLVNGTPTALSYVSPSQVQLQMPFQTPEKWTVVVRRGLMQSDGIELSVVPVRPALIGASKFDTHWEIYLTGLGMVDPVPRAGAGANAQEPFNRATAAIETSTTLLYAGLAPYQPYLYQINVTPPPPGARLELAVAGIAIDVR